MLSSICPRCAELLSGDSPACPSCRHLLDDPERRTELLMRRCIIGAFVLAATATLDHLLLTWLHARF